MEEDTSSVGPLLEAAMKEIGASSPPHLQGRLRSNSECEVVHHVGNLQSYSMVEAASADATDGASVSVAQRKRWDLNYREAAIFLQEGENNDKFTAHPRSQLDLPAYMITHSLWFYLLTFGASLLILSLAIFEEPSIDHLSLPIPIHASLEMLCLVFITIELTLKIKWLGIKAFVRHVRSMIKAAILLVMFVEVIVLIIRDTNHFRVTRALRPIFILDSYYGRGVRRFIRQIIQALPPIIDMLVLLLFFMLLFSMLGFYLFSDNRDDAYFHDILSSFINMFILLTSANFPDVMMPAYNKNRWSAAFFILYISIELFLFMNLFLAVVYSAFINIEKDKLRKLLIHRRLACGAAFRLLVSAQHPDSISVRHFAGCMKYFRPRLTRRDVFLTFKTLDVDRSGKLSEAEFMSVYDTVSLKWKRYQAKQEIWSSRFRSPLNKIGIGLYRFVTWKIFEYLVYIVIVANLVWILSDTIHLSVIMSDFDPSNNKSWDSEEHKFLWISIIFVVFYCVEALLKILGLGPIKYFSSGWNIFDFIVTLVGLLGILFQLVSNSFYYIIVLRPLRVLRLFKLKRRFRDVFGTLFILFSRMISLAVAMLLLYYSFAILGMEIFASYSPQLRNCCKNSSIEQYYIFNVSGYIDGYYYLNSFDNIFMSSVTLFELTVVNNWWIIMEGYASVVSGWTRIYFMVFYLIVMVVMTTTVAFILEAFIFRIQYRDKMKGADMDDHAIRKVDMALTADELALCVTTAQPLTIEANHCEDPVSSCGDALLTWFRGEKVLSKNDFSLKMYSQEVQEWLTNEPELTASQRFCIPSNTQPPVDEHQVLIS